MSTHTSKRGRLDLESIVEAGLEIAARPGVSKVAVRELGQMLGSDPTAIYRHVRNKDALMLAMLDALEVRAVAAVTAPLTDWRGRLTQLAEATVTLLTAHPAIGVEAIVATTHGEGELAAVELILTSLKTAGLGEDEMVRFYALFSQHMMAASAGLARASIHDGPDRYDGGWFDSVPRADPARHPNLAALAPRLGALQDLDLFRLGLEMILDAVEREAAGS